MIHRFKFGEPKHKRPAVALSGHQRADVLAMRCPLAARIWFETFKREDVTVRWLPDLAGEREVLAETFEPQRSGLGSVVR